MPAKRPYRADPRPQTSRQVRRAYLRSNQAFQFTATQLRASERRDLLDKRAKDIQAKEKRAKENKRKREEKGAAEREVKRRRIEEGKLPAETAWGKVRASQPRLHTFFVQPKPATKRGESEDTSESENGTEEDNLSINDFVDQSRFFTWIKA